MSVIRLLKPEDANVSRRKMMRMERMTRQHLPRLIYHSPHQQPISWRAQTRMSKEPKLKHQYSLTDIKAR
jgi:hypothetical protein